jgi:hypothetical protein
VFTEEEVLGSNVKLFEEKTWNTEAATVEYKLVKYYICGEVLYLGPAMY